MSDVPCDPHDWQDQGEGRWVCAHCKEAGETCPECEGTGWVGPDEGDESRCLGCRGAGVIVFEPGRDET